MHLGPAPSDPFHKQGTGGLPGWAPGMTLKLFERTGGRYRWQIMVDPGKLIGRGLVLHIFWWQCYTFVLTLTAPENNCCLGKQCPLSWRVWKLGCAVISLPILWVVLNVLCSLYIVHFWMLATYSSVSHPIMKYFRTFWCHIKVESISYSYICKQLNP